MNIRDWISNAISNIANNKEYYKLTEKQLKALEYFEEGGVNELIVVDEIVDKLELEDVMLEYLEYIKL